MVSPIIQFEAIIERSRYNDRFGLKILDRVTDYWRTCLLVINCKTVSLTADYTV